MNSRDACSWDTNQIRFLLERRQEGDSAAEIAAAMGVSRNAVAGKLHRLGTKGMPRKKVPSNAVKVRVQARVFPTNIVRQKPAKPLPKPKPEPLRQLKTLFELAPGECRWPMGHLFCGAEAQGSYCQFHRQRSLQGYEERKRHQRSQASRESGPPSGDAAA